MEDTSDVMANEPVEPAPRPAAVTLPPPPLPRPDSTLRAGEWDLDRTTRFVTVALCNRIHPI